MKLELRRELSTIYTGGKRIVVYNNGDVEEENLGEEAPTEPLIKDEKIREVIRLWTKINGATELKYFEGENCLEDIFRNEIHFNQLLELKDGKTYTTEELCGEEEE